MESELFKAGHAGFNDDHEHVDFDHEDTYWLTLQGTDEAGGYFNIRWSILTFRSTNATNKITAQVCDPAGILGALRFLIEASEEENSGVTFDNPSFVEATTKNLVSGIGEVDENKKIRLQYYLAIEDITELDAAKTGSISITYTIIN